LYDFIGINNRSPIADARNLNPLFLSRLLYGAIMALSLRRILRNDNAMITPYQCHNYLHESKRSNFNHFNPFNPNTKSKFDLAESSPARLDVYNMKDQLVKKF